MWGVGCQAIIWKTGPWTILGSVFFIYMEQVLVLNIAGILFGGR